ncbi:MAG TPA: substrate-binding domain-containing protein [Solirubrobacteraceae bacterium]|nr:substrate-binding domain-containing protein [Solirubrobacteraceae bacterium]
MRAHRTLIVMTLLALALPAPVALAARRLIIGGSTSVLPLAQKLATAYHHAFPRIPAPKVLGGQSDVGISGAAAGRFDIGDSSRDPIKGVDPRGLSFTKIARDGICVITNSSNPIGNLSQQTVQAIFRGGVHNWNEVPGARISGTIDLFDRDGASGTQDAFQNIFLGPTLKVSPIATAETSNGLEQNAVQNDTHGIGFVSFAYTAGVNAVGYQGVACNLRNAKSGQYQGVRNFWMVTKGAPKGEAAKFIDWVIKKGNRIVRAIVGSSWIPVY